MVAGHIEPLSGLMRIGGTYGEDFTWAVTLRYLAPDDVELLAALRAPTSAEWKAAWQVMAAAGIQVCRLRRYGKREEERVFRWDGERFRRSS